MMVRLPSKRKLYKTEANLSPDIYAKTLTVGIHTLATPKDNRIARILCEQLNETEIKYPDTELVIKYKLVSD